MKSKSLRSRARLWWKREIRPLLIMVLVLCAVRSSLADWNDVPSGSMKPTILEGDRIYVNKLAYDLKLPFTTWHIAEWSDPQRGDIVVLFSPHDGTRLVKRVIGLPGDIVEMRDNHVLLNGERVEYGPLDTRVSSQLADSERTESQFATEQLPGRDHAVMAIPSIPGRRTFDAVRVPEGHYFVMGDNRDNSFDSRFYGTVPRSKIVGRATAVVVSLNRTDKWQPRWQRFFTPLD